MIYHNFLVTACVIFLMLFPFHSQTYGCLPFGTTFHCMPQFPVERVYAIIM